ncbi:hypothetical protein P4O66_001389 [Electrophorus voltai]|uniref:GBD/FH3 domain-containing protein n=1 Tax=Electrophorus voltai TaxID=2609070 RepID=A0AAD8Z923_9TELE|nr:hypothetical protein P4O66_001389 [Electrophorus voltai]
MWRGVLNTCCSALERSCPYGKPCLLSVWACAWTGSESPDEGGAAAAEYRPQPRYVPDGPRLNRGESRHAVPLTVVHVCCLLVVRERSVPVDSAGSGKERPPAFGPARQLEPGGGSRSDTGSNPASDCESAAELPERQSHPRWASFSVVVQNRVNGHMLTCFHRRMHDYYLQPALGQIMLYVDGMNGLIGHNETVQWLYALVGSKFRLVVKTALKLLLVFVEYTEPNAALLIQAVNAVDTKRGCKPWSNAMEILDEKDGVDTELLVYVMTLVNKTLAGLPDQDSFYDVVDCLEEQGIEGITQRHLRRKGTDLDLLEQFNIYEMTLRHEDGDDETSPPPAGRKDRRRASVGGTHERRGLERRRSRRHSLHTGKGHASAPSSPCHGNAHNSMPLSGQRIEDVTEREDEVEEEEVEEQEVRELQKAQLSKQGPSSWTAPTVAIREEASSLCLPFKCMVNLIPRADGSEVQESIQSCSGTKVISRAPVSGPLVTPDCGPCNLTSWASVRSLGALPSRGSSVTSSASTSPGEEPLSPPAISSSSLRSSCPSDLDEVPVGTPQGQRGLDAEKCSRPNGYAGTFPGRTSAVSSAPPSAPFNRCVSTGGPAADRQPDRPALGGLLTSSYRQHQESLAAERERRRLERVERLHRIEREERSRFSRDYEDKREEIRHAREERYSTPRLPRRL